MMWLCGYAGCLPLGCQEGVGTANLNSQKSLTSPPQTMNHGVTFREWDAFYLP